MDMDHLIGQRFNLISKSEIRYVGTLHEINPEQSTIALEDVYSFGTEGRKVESFIPASQQKFEYIVFRGSDVKDIKIAEETKENQQPSPPSIPNDPAILNSSRPGQGPPQNRGHSPFLPPGYPPQSQFPGYYPPQQYGRGFGPPPGGFGPGPAYQGMPYGPPPPGYFAPPGQGFPPGPPQFQQQPPPIGPPGQQQPAQGGPQQQTSRGQAQGLKPTSELPVDNKLAPKPTSKAPTPTPETKKTAPSAESTAVASGAPAAGTAPQPPTFSSIAAKPAPTGPKASRVVPAMPFTVNQKSFTPPVPASNGPLSSTTNTNQQQAAKPMSTAAQMQEASRQAKEAVAAAMAKLNPQAPTAAKPAPMPGSVEALTRKVSEMRTTEPSHRGRAGYRARGEFRRGSGGHPAGQTRKIEIPTSDYDFESANAKFNKEDLIKEAIASGSPLGETSESNANVSADVEAERNGEKSKESLQPATTQAYNKSSSFFDNISSEAKDREESNEARAGGRIVRGEEFKKNVETFGQGNVDGGYRGRGRGGFRGRGRGQQRGYGASQQGGFSRGGGGGGGGFGGRGRTGNGPEGAAQAQW